MNFKMKYFALLVLLTISFSCVKETNTTTCEEKTELIKELDARDYPEQIPGETMGQKLESLLFWEQDEKERRFGKMHLIYPSILVSAGDKVSGLDYNKEVNEKLDHNYFENYMNSQRVKGIIAIHNDRVILEKYAEDVNEKTLWTSYSVAKSIASMLVGVALKNGDIGSMDDPLGMYIPEFEGKDYGKVTVKQLLSMTSGINWNEDYVDPNSDVAQMYQKPCVGDEAHILTYMKDMKLNHEPGKFWNYSTGETDLVGILIQKASGKSLGAYLSEHIWQPYGMESCAYWLADECSNLNIGGSGLSASLRDYARLGSLMLLDGKIDGESIFAEEWLAGATQPMYNTGEEGAYGYLWWVNPDGSYLAQGIFGQMVYINPKHNLVVAQMAAWPHAGSEELSASRVNFIQSVIDALD